MKNLVLGSLLLAALASQTIGCTTDLATIDVDWSFRTVNPKGELSPPNSCPAGYNTVALHNQEVDAADRLIGEPIIDLFDCVDMSNFSDPLPPGFYETFISVTSDGGASIYADSLAAIVDVTTSDKTFSAQIVDNGGYFKIAWDLRKQNLPVTCRDVAGLSGIDITSTIAGTAQAVSDTFDCENGFDFSDALIEDMYVVSVSGLDSTNKAIGTTATLNNKVIANRNRVTDLGTVTLSF